MDEATTAVTTAESTATLAGVGYTLLAGIAGIILWGLREFISVALEQWRRYMSAPKDAIASNKPKVDDEEDSSSAAFPAADGTPRTDRFINRFKIEEHYFFATTKSLVAHRIPKLECGCPVRTEMLRDMLTIYITQWREALEKFCDDEIRKDGFESKAVGYAGGFASRVSEMMLKLRSDTNKVMMDHGVPQLAIDALSAWESPWMETIGEHTEKVASGTFVLTNRERLIVILTLHATYLSTVLMEAKYALQRINGTLDGQIYKGRRIAPVQHPHGPSGDDRALTKKQRSGEIKVPR